MHCDDDRVSKRDDFRECMYDKTVLVVESTVAYVKVFLVAINIGLVDLPLIVKLQDNTVIEG